MPLVPGLVRHGCLPAFCVTGRYANLERQLAAPPGRAVLAGVAKHAGQLALIATMPITFALPRASTFSGSSLTRFTAGSGEAFRRVRSAPVMPPPPVAATGRHVSPRRRRARAKSAVLRVASVVCAALVVAEDVSGCHRHPRRGAFSLGTAIALSARLDGAAVSVHTARGTAHWEKRILNERAVCAVLRRE